MATKHETQFLIENPELAKTKVNEYKLLGLEIRQLKILVSRSELSLKRIMFMVYDSRKLSESLMRLLIRVSSLKSAKKRFEKKQFFLRIWIQLDELIPNLWKFFKNFWFFTIFRENTV